MSIRVFIQISMLALLLSGPTRALADTLASDPVDGLDQAAGPPADQAPDPAFERFRPAILKYAASVLFISLESELRQEKVSSEQAQASLYVPEEKSQPLQPSARGVIRQQMTTDVLGRKSTHITWLNPDTRILQRTSLDTGRKQRHRIHRYLEDGVYSIRRTPAGDQEKDWEKWSRVEKETLPYTPEARKHVLTEAGSIFYLIGAAGFEEPGDQRELILFDNDGLVQVTLRVEEQKRLKVDFESITENGRERVRGNLDTLRIQLSVQPLEAGASTENFSFMGYRDNISLYLDPRRGVVVQASGKVDYVGMVDIRLQQADFRL